MHGKVEGGRLLSPSIGNVDMERGIMIVDPRDSLVRYSLLLLGHTNSYFENLIISNRNGEVHSYILKYVPDTSWLESYREESNLRYFCGEVSILSIDKVPYSTSQFRNGVSFKTLYHSTYFNGRANCDDGDTGGGITTEGSINGGAAGQGCYWYFDDATTIVIDCIEPAPTNLSDANTRTPCITAPTGGYEDMEPIGVVLPISKPTVLLKSDTIYNAVTTECFKQAIEMAINRGLKNKISETLNEVFSHAELIDLTFEEGDYLDPDEAAITDGAIQSNGRITINIVLNRIALVNSSQEFILATIFHEAIHAILKINTEDTIFDSHEQMASDYLEEMSDALKELFPAISIQDAAALVWGGLFETSSWNKLAANDPSSANQILKINQGYLNGAKGKAC
jgi:hypothetical protein